MKKIGMLVAVEIDPVLRRYGEPDGTLSYPGYEILCYKNEAYELYVLRSGAGEIAAAAGTQFLISVIGADLVLNFGVVGGLTEEMKHARVCVVETIIHYDHDVSAWNGKPAGWYQTFPDARIPAMPELVRRAREIHPELKSVVCASGDRFIGTAEKASLHSRFGADICEMEAAGVAITCLRCGTPFLLIKAVSDALTEGGADFSASMQQVADLCLETADRIIREL